MLWKLSDLRLECTWGIYYIELTLLHLCPCASSGVCWWAWSSRVATAEHKQKWSRFFESRAESRFPNPTVRANSAGELKRGTVASDRHTHARSEFRELRELYETLNFPTEKTWRDPIPSSQGCLQFLPRLDLWTRRLRSHTQSLSLSHSQISLSCARCLVSESDCPGQFRRRIKTWNCRVTHERTTWIYI
jgi:hypothetical protein